MRAICHKFVPWGSPNLNFRSRAQFAISYRGVWNDIQMRFSHFRNKTLGVLQQDRAPNRLRTSNSLFTGIGDSRLLTCLGVSKKRDDDRHVVFCLSRVFGVCTSRFCPVEAVGAQLGCFFYVATPGLCPRVAHLFDRQLRSGFSQVP